MRWLGPRPLTAEEARLLRDYFGDNLRYSRIRLGATPLRLSARACSPWGSTAWFPRFCFIDSDPRRGLDLERPAVRRRLVHEATHIWQRQHGDWVSCRALPLQARYLLGRNVYRYDDGVDDPGEFLALFRRGNIEQQGQMIEDLEACRAGGGDPARWSAILEHLRSRS